MSATHSLEEALRWIGVQETARRVRDGELTPQQTVSAALARIDAAQPQLNAFARVWHERALADADRVAERLAAGESLPLAGVPVAAKDEVAIAGEVTTKGSRTMTAVATSDAELIRLVRAAGGVIVGATRTPELCFTPYCESELGGVTRNPWDHARTPGGSSGGAAAAVAAGLVPVALASDGGGSIRGPAAWCGLPGLFATPGLVSPAPLHEPWTGMVSYGGIARTIADTALLYDVLFTHPVGLAAALTQEPEVVRIVQTLDRAADRPVPQGGPIDGSCRSAVREIADLLRELGHEVQPRRVRFAAAGAKFAVRYATSAREDLLRTDEPQLAEPVTRLVARVGGVLRRLRPWALDLARERAALDRSLGDAQVIVTPTMPCTAPPVGERDGRHPLLTVLAASRRVSLLNTWNLLGWPGLTVPAGTGRDGLPVGVLLTGRPGSERLLLQLGAQLERARPWPLGAGAPERSAVVSVRAELSR
ncbi:MAG: amidase family protein [Patulibacter sp.]